MNARAGGATGTGTEAGPTTVTATERETAIVTTIVTATATATAIMTTIVTATETETAIAIATATAIETAVGTVNVIATGIETAMKTPFAGALRRSRAAANAVDGPEIRRLYMVIIGRRQFMGRTFFPSVGTGIR